jgi:DNA-binding protein HU-beta
MNKTDLIDAMAEHAGITKAASKKALECMLIEIEGALQKGNRVSLVGFGSWSVTRRAARDGRNPQTGKTIKIAAKNVVKFKPGAELKNSVN